MVYTQRYASPLGVITLESDGEALTGLWFNGQKYFGSTLKGERADGRPKVFDEAERWLDIYFSGKAPEHTPPLKVSGSVFRRAVWDSLLDIPFGHTATYGEIAELTANRLGIEWTSARAVGGAVGHNPISLIIPCHRVVGAGGSLTGYAGGIERKRWLLEMERTGLPGARL